MPLAADVALVVGPLVAGVALARWTRFPRGVRGELLQLGDTHVAVVRAGSTPSGRRRGGQ